MEADEAQGSDDDVDWRPRFEAGLLSAKQSKLAEAIRSREYKIQVHAQLRAHLCVRIVYTCVHNIASTNHTRSCSRKFEGVHSRVRS